MISNAIFLNASINKDRDFKQFKSNRFGKEKSRDSENNFETFGIFHKIRNCLGGNESKYKRLKLQKTPKRGSFRFKNWVAEIQFRYKNHRLSRTWNVFWATYFSSEIHNRKSSECIWNKLWKFILDIIYNLGWVEQGVGTGVDVTHHWSVLID